jgi:signal transduction histidine kinase
VEPEGAPAVPAPLAAAAAHAVREALANVASHAGTGEAWVEISLPERGGRGAGPAGLELPAGLEVTVRDAGVGFDPAHIDPARLGVRRSIIERVADWGGQASVQSAPGAGTVVSLRWAARPEPDEGAAAAASSGVADGRSRSW